VKQRQGAKKKGRKADKVGQAQGGKGETTSLWAYSLLGRDRKRGHLVNLVTWKGSREKRKRYRSCGDSLGGVRKLCLGKKEREENRKRNH